MRYNNTEARQYRKDAYMTKIAISTRPRREGFTLIELLIVMIVISILAVILVPTINKVIVSADNRKSQAYVQQVAAAAANYKDANNGRYPGQDDTLQLAGTVFNGTPGPYTGSQILAARLFDYPDSHIQDITLSDKPEATSKYLQYKVDRLISQSSTGNSIPKNSMGDDSKTLNALLYFPSRPNVTSNSPSDHYKWDDSGTYVSGSVSSEFNKCTTDSRSGSVRDPGGILIIGTGINDTYLESTDNDDIQSWNVD